MWNQDSGGCSDVFMGCLSPLGTDSGYACESGECPNRTPEKE